MHNNKISYNYSEPMSWETDQTILILDNTESYHLICQRLQKLHLWSYPVLGRELKKRFNRKVSNRTQWHKVARYLIDSELENIRNEVLYQLIDKIKTLSIGLSKYNFRLTWNDIYLMETYNSLNFKSYIEYTNFIVWKRDCIPDFNDSHLDLAHTAKTIVRENLYDN